MPRPKVKLLPATPVFTFRTRTLFAELDGDWNAYRSVMSDCTLPPGGDSPGASRWSAARADDGPAFCVRASASASAAAAAANAAIRSVVRCACTAALMPFPSLSFARPLGETRRIRERAQIGSPNRFDVLCERQVDDETEIASCSRRHGRHRCGALVRRRAL